jgi:GntR family transcriptional regulator / MocR family aminotransferase
MYDVSVAVHVAAAGLHFHVMLPPQVDEESVVRAAHSRGVLLEAGAWHWQAPEHAPPSIVLGYGSAAEPVIRRGVAVLADVLESAPGRI